MKITVFGGSGFLGSHVCDKLSEAGHEVTIFDARPSPWFRPDQRMIVGDILDENLVDKTVKESEIIFNFAGLADIGEANTRPIDTVRYNILGNTIILDACRKAKVSRYIFASSVYVYSNSGGFYRCSKQACEAYIETFQENFGLEYTILRYGSLYGPRADERNAIYRYILQALKEKKIHYYGREEALREYIHVEDAALSSLEMLKPEYANQNVILTGHQPMKVRNVLKMIVEMLGEDIELFFETNPSSGHYDITPYSFSPKIGKKWAPPLHMDLGQGFLRVIEEIHKKLHPELHEMEGVLVKG
jgi:UDP-glucose 4-epimerase